MKFIFSNIVLISLCCSIYGQSFVSGYYSGSIPLFFAFDSITNNISGYIEVKSEEDENKKSCVLYFQGTFTEGNSVKISFYDYFDMKHKDSGTILLKPDGAIWISSHDFIMPCSNLIAISKGEFAVLKKTYPFSKISVIKNRKQYFYSTPKFNSIRSSYMLYYDPVGVIKDEGNWLYVKYLKNSMLTGWIPKDSVY